MTPANAPTKVVAFGYDELLLASLEFLASANAEISAVVFPATRNDTRAVRVREMVTELGHSTLEQPAGRAAAFTESLCSARPDIFLVWSYPMILPDDLLNIPRLGAVNIHQGLLPEYRGVNGVRWALLHGEQHTGVTMHFMDSGIDTGDMIARAAFPIEPTDDIRTLMQKSRLAGLHLLKNLWRHIAAGTAVRMPQDHAIARYYSAAMAPPDSIDWHRPAIDIHNLVRASAPPFPGVHTSFGEHRITIRRTEPLVTQCSEVPGTIERLDAESLEIASGDGIVSVEAFEINGEPAGFTDLIALGLGPGHKLPA
ncbi:MAG: methionyl-tRNA formyltransferase [Pyrinomonadaceae bacterium]|nr:methionyl-tRNA formyltransferase [Pyrinomonadaceae bacterium]